MSRVAVFGKMSGDNRSVTVGGRSRNDSIKAWINFDYFKRVRRDSTRSPKGYVEEIKEQGTNSVTTEVWRNSEGKVYVDFRTNDFTAGHTDNVEVRVMGIKLEYLLEAYKMLEAGKGV